MKFFESTILVILVIAGTSCEQAVNVEKEKEAIRAVLEEVSGLLGDALSADGSLIASNAVNRKENMIIKVTGNTAWVTCDNIWEYSSDGEKGGYSNIQVNFLEKIKGEWKISFAAYYSKPQQ